MTDKGVNPDKPAGPTMPATLSEALPEVDLESLTPAMRQYHEVKQRYPSALLLFQMGDFYETFYQDAIDLARALNITLTSRGKDGDTPIPLAGFPMKALDGYLPKLVRADFRVVIVDQVEDPKLAKGVVKRDVARIVTPGTVLEDALLEPTRENFIACMVPGKGVWGVAWAELTTGRFRLAAAEDSHLENLLTRIGPAEVVVSDSLLGEARDRLLDLEKRFEMRLSPVSDWIFNHPTALKALHSHLGVANLGGFGIEDEGGIEVTAAGALLQHLKDQQRSELSHLSTLEVYAMDETIVLDSATVAALELVQTLRGRERQGTLVWALDDCVTSMGSRLLRSWILAPLRSQPELRLRHASVEELAYQKRRREMVRDSLKGLGDLERLAGRLGCGRVVARDLIGLRSALEKVPLVKNSLSGVEASLLTEIELRLDEVAEARDLITAAINEEAPQTLKDGGTIRDGFSPELDELRTMQRDGKRYIARFQAQEQESSGIPNLKVGYTSVFGYYLEITNAHREKVPAHWIRKQTLKNAERYITPELKEIETKVLNAESEASSLEARLFNEVRERLAPFATRIQASARLLALLDVLAGFAALATLRGYVRPELHSDRRLHISEGRHPVLELTLKQGQVVPNDCNLPQDKPIALITGPNMAGKSTYIRMVASLTIMAQIGSFVPAMRMELGLVDRIFTRLGSGDEIQRGISTFMLEMMETANILNNATEASLVVLDEVGRGTSTFDGVSIAWAITEHLADQLKARTLFATHYHELTQLAARLPEVANYNVAVREWNDEVIFLHKIVEGAADRSYGIYVAKIAGLPASVVARSKEVLGKLEKEVTEVGSSVDGLPRLRRPKGVQLTLFTPAENRIVRLLRELEVGDAPPEVLRAKLTQLKALASEVDG